VNGGDTFVCDESRDSIFAIVKCNIIEDIKRDEWVQLWIGCN